MYVVSTTIRPRNWPALLPLVMAAFVFYLDKKEPEDLRWVVILLFAVAGFVWFLLQKTEVSFDDLALTHQNLFTTKTIQWNEVTAAYLKYRQHGQSGSYYWYFENVHGKKFKFSVSLYSRASLRSLAEAVVTKCRHAEIEPRINSMAAGDFPWYIF